MSKKQVFLVGGRSNDHPVGDARSMGFKGWNLARMASMGLPVPHAIVLGTGYCGATEGRHALAELREALAANVRWLEQASGYTYGGSRKPLLVSVRSGAPVSMPGMMDTILNVGLTDATVRGLLRMTGNPRLVWDSYRRLVQSFAETVHAAAAEPFQKAAREQLNAAGVVRPQELDGRRLEALARHYLDMHRQVTGCDFPQDPMEQLHQSVAAVFRSWNSPRAVEYRKLQGLPSQPGTAVTVQRMVFGNAGGLSGSGVAFTRNPATGAKELYLDFVFNGQGEDVVSGRHAVGGMSELAAVLPDMKRELFECAERLEQAFKDAQEFEFTIQERRLYLLQTRAGKCSPLAAVRIAVDQVREGLVSSTQALKRLNGIDLDAVRVVRVVPDDATQLVCHAVAAATGVASGRIALDADRAVAMAADGAAVILVRPDTTTSDIKGIAAAAGLLTALGGRTSHAAVVARQMGKVCLVGCSGLAVDEQSRFCTLGGRRFAEGDVICLDANEGRVYAGEPRRVVESQDEFLKEIARWRVGGNALTAS